MLQYITKIKNFVSNLAELNEELNKMEATIKEKDQINSEAQEVNNNQIKKKYQIELDNAFKYVSKYL